MARYFSKAKYLQWCAEVKKDPSCWVDQADGKKVVNRYIKFDDKVFVSFPEWEIEHN